ncbi:hypothetical protein AGMMS49532_00390 [Endomicrobiia bacterium]|uniref:hypothetical protein n=1 Tax=Endomicrobium trichonymphae TaxID=1408204 RepID=UPI000BBAC02D|nr:hypothetical protein [Candidatus Endomicrobium trichonymphae]GHT07515.1 hypothetical protein AGMMS49532_00390 [Endomicrobiia bacterium]
MKKVVSLMLLALTFSACSQPQTALNKKIFRSMEVAYEKIEEQFKVASPNWSIITEYLDYLSTAATLKNKINSGSKQKKQ